MYLRYLFRMLIFYLLFLTFINYLIPIIILFVCIIFYLLYNFAKDIYKNSTETYKREKRERTHTKKKNNKIKQKL